VPFVHDLAFGSDLNKQYCAIKKAHKFKHCLYCSLFLSFSNYLALTGLLQRQWNYLRLIACNLLAANVNNKSTDEKKSDKWEKQGEAEKIVASTL